MPPPQWLPASQVCQAERRQRISLCTLILPCIQFSSFSPFHPHCSTIRFTLGTCPCANQVKFLFLGRRNTELLLPCRHRTQSQNRKKIKRLAWEQRWDLPLVFMASTQPSVAFQCRHTGNLVVMFAGVQSRLASCFLYQIGHRQTCFTCSVSCSDSYLPELKSEAMTQFEIKGPMWSPAAGNP